jgi:hypothetical protein
VNVLVHVNVNVPEIVLKMPECAGKLKQSNKQRYLSIARGVAMDRDALFDLLNAICRAYPDGYHVKKTLLTRITAGLSKPYLQPAPLALRVRSRLRALARSRPHHTEPSPLESRKRLKYQTPKARQMRPETSSTEPTPSISLSSPPLR